MKCPKCQNIIPDNQNFCPNCGTPKPKKGYGCLIAILIFIAILLVSGYFAIRVAGNLYHKFIAEINTYENYNDPPEEEKEKKDPTPIEKPEEKPTPQKELTKEDYLKGIVELPTGNYNKEEAQNMINRLGLFDIKLLKLMYDNKGVIILIDGPITDDYRFSSLKGVVPRGWEKTGSTWDDVPGAGSYPYTIVRIGKSFPSYENNHSTIILELHETAHMLDQLLGNPSQLEGFKQIVLEEEDKMFKGSEYLKYPEEYWAECIAYYTYSDSSRKELKTKAPKTYAYFEELIKNL